MSPGVMRCSRCGFDAAPEHFKDDLCVMCATPLGLDERLPRRTGRPYGPMVKCRCGCGATFHQFDKKGRPRIAMAGHYQRDKIKRTANGRYAS